MFESSTYESFRNLCMKRKSTRSFSGIQIPDEDIRKILEIGKTSPYASSGKNWDILIVKESDIISRIFNAVELTVIEMLENVKTDFKESFQSYSQSFLCFKDAPVLFIPVYRYAGVLPGMLKEITEELMEWERDTYVKSISCVAMLMHLAAESLGYGSCYMTGPLIAEDKIREIVGVRNGYSVGAVIPVGITAPIDN